MRIESVMKFYAITSAKNQGIDMDTVQGIDMNPRCVNGRYTYNNGQFSQAFKIY